MDEREPSRTALAAAGHRAAHQILEQGRLFADPFAIPILGVSAERIESESRLAPERIGMRLFLAARAAFAEACLGRGVEQRGIRQLVVLGAGLDTFAYRNPFGDRLRVFEVDHPATQAWKRRRLADMDVVIPPNVVFTSVNFERERFQDQLLEAGFDPARRTFFTWLGVVPYLTRPAIETTLSTIGGVAGGAEVAFDYSDPPHTLPEALQAAHKTRSARVASLGEPFLSQFEPADLHGLLEAAGLSEIEDLGPRDLADRVIRPAFPDTQTADRRDGPLGNRGGHVVHAATPMERARTVAAA